jgi:hypothetical protein
MLLRIFYAAGHYRIHRASCCGDCCPPQAIDWAADEYGQAEQFASQCAVFLHVWADVIHTGERLERDLWLFTKFMPCTQGLPLAVSAWQVA